MEQVRIVSFDAGGTLVYPWPGVGAIYSEVMWRHGLHYAPAAVEAAFGDVWERAQDWPRKGRGLAREKAWWRRIVHETLLAVGPPPDEGAFAAMYEELFVAFADPVRWRLFPGAVAVLAELRRRGYRLAIVSNADSRMAGLLERLGLLAHVEHVVISADLGHEKPDREIFAHAESLFAAPPEQFVHVGDSRRHDVEGARGAGWQALHLRHGESGAALGSLHELLPLLPGPST